MIRRKNSSERFAHDPGGGGKEKDFTLFVYMIRFKRRIVREGPLDGLIMTLIRSVDIQMHLGPRRALLVIVSLYHEVGESFEACEVITRLTRDEEDLGFDPETEIAFVHDLNGLEKW